MSTAQYYTDADSKKVEESREESISSIGKGDDASSTIDKEFERRTMRYVDWRIIPVLALVYSFSLIDRINLGAAYTAGMGADLHLAVGARFNIVSCMYFVPYILLQLPGNFALRKFGVREWLTFIVVAWGAVQLGMGFVKNWQQLVVTRVLLGIFEASFFPSLIFIISTWYKRHEVQQRLAAFYLISVTAGGLSPLLGYVISLLNGRCNLAGWRWIFIIEGAITLFLGIVTWFFIPSFPDQNTFLSPEQTALVLKRIDDDRGDALPDPVTFEKIKAHLCDWTIWAFGFMFLCGGLPSYAQSIFLPIILKGMGWTKTAALLRSVPPYAPSIITTMIISWLSDKHKHRAGFIAGSSLVCIVGVSLTAYAKQNEVRYLGAFLTTIGNSGCIPTIIAYSSNNVVSHSKRTVQSAVTVAFAGVSGLVATNIFRSKDAPRYTPGLSATMGSQGLLLLLLAITTFHFSRQNRLSREGKLSKPLQGQPGFYYTL